MDYPIRIIGSNLYLLTTLDMLELSAASDFHFTLKVRVSAKTKVAPRLANPSFTSFSEASSFLILGRFCIALLPLAGF
jgi:hypothetical protein